MSIPHPVPPRKMALSATGRTLRIRRQVYNPADSPGWSDGMHDDDDTTTRPLASSKLRLRKNNKKVSVRVQLDGPPDNFSSGSVVGSNIPNNDDDGALSSDDELFKDVRTYLRQTMGKSAVQKAESGICGIGEYVPEKGSQWLDGGNYVTVRHPLPDVPIDVPPLPVIAEGGAISSISTAGLKYRLPLTCAHWFDARHVADIERAELPTMGISEDMYRELRDRILDAYNADPSKFLSVRNAREATGFAETSVLVRIWSFLDYWGIINYYCDPTTAPRFSKKLIDFPWADQQAQASSVECCACHKLCRFVAYALRAESAPMIPTEHITRAKFCSTCFNTNAYPPFFSRDAFEALDVVIPGTANPEWTEEETMRLLEGIERFGTDWSAIASLIGGGKTAAQCLLHFSQLPMQPKPVRSGGTVEKFAPTVNPFRDSDDPILCLLTMLASVVPTEIGTAVAIAGKQPDDVEMMKFE
jgi:hypothetical protein